VSLFLKCDAKIEEFSHITKFFYKKLHTFLHFFYNSLINKEKKYIS
jgi:hypothetical protein